MKSLTKLLSITLATTMTLTANDAVIANNQLGLDLLNQVNGKENTCISPYSIQSALGMTALGAQGNTRTEMEKVLHYPTDGKFHAQMKAYEEDIMERVKKEGSVELSTANRLFIQETIPVKESFLSDTKNYYRSDTDSMDFAQNPEKARVKINQWVAKETKDKIEDLLPEASLTPLTRLVITNAIYFKAPWTRDFKKSATRNGDFTNEGGQVSKVKFMRATASYPILSKEKYEAISIPYGKNREFQFSIILPAEEETLDGVLRTLTTQEITEITTARKVKARLSLPKFKHEGQSIDLSSALKTMGMKDAFNEQLADFSAMAEEDLSISQVSHKTFLEVDESGAEAAAATAVVIKARSARPGDEPRSFIIDRPFLYMIQDRKTSMCLFMGTVKTL